MYTKKIVSSAEGNASLMYWYLKAPEIILQHAVEQFRSLKARAEYLPNLRHALRN